MSEIFLELELPPYKLIDLYMDSKGIPSKWLADYTDVSKVYICLIRSGKVTLTNKMREKINDILGTDY